MTANELRIGNLVNYQIDDVFKDRKPYFGKSIYKVVCVLDDSVKIDIGFDSAQRVLFTDPKLKSIPITKKRLLSLGFLPKKGCEWVYEKFPLSINMGNHGIVSIIATNNEYFHPVQFDGYPIHKLQNLYYDLKVEELKILNPI